MKSIPYIEYTKIEDSDFNTTDWYHMSHLSNACATADAHRTSAYAICLLSEGDIQLESDLFVHISKAPAIFTLAPSAIRKFTDIGEGYKAKIFFFRKEIFLEGQTDITYLEQFDFFEKKGQEVIPLNAEEFQMFTAYFDLIQQKSTDVAPHTSEIIRSLIYIILNEIDDVHYRHLPEREVVKDQNLNLLSEFKILLAKHFMEERQVSFYAEKMNLTPKYFSTVIKEVSGKTAGTWINEMLLLESKVRLQNKKQSIAQIADSLNFSDPSHFGKFFKKHTGRSPLEYRS